MARSRNLKPGFFTNDTLGECDPLARILFAGLWCIADREGRLEDRPKRIRAELLPYDQCDADALLDQLADRGFVVRYESGGNRYIQVANFDKHQNPHVKEQASNIPAPDKHGACPVQSSDMPDKSTEVAGLIPSSLIPDSLNLIPDSLKEHGAQAAPVAPKTETALQAACRETWAAYCEAYADAYGAQPVRAAKQSSQVKQIVQSLGADEAPLVVAWFVRHPAQWYVTKGHDIGLLLADIVKLRTEWATGRIGTTTAAKQSDRRGAMASAVQNLLAECGGAT